MGYWENRQAQMMYEYMEYAEKVSQEIADIYAKASTHLSLKTDRIYKKFKDKNNLTDKDAIKLLNTLKDRTDIGELKKALKKSRNTAFLAKIESGAYKARIERLENLQSEIDRMMQQVFEQEKKVTTSHYVDLATNSYYREIYNVQRQVGFQFSFSAVDPEAVNMLLKSKWSGLNYSERIWKNTQNLARDVKEQMIIGLLTGKRQEEMAREIAIRYATGAFEARRLVRTESNFVNGQMQLAAYEECGAEKYEFVATLDLRTSAQCRELDGKVFLVKDAMPGNNMNPMHPFCRSTTIIHLDDTVLEGLQRRARNPITGENELVPADLNYQEWYKNSVFNNSKAQNAEQMIKNRSYDKKQFEKYKEVIGKNIWKNLVDFQQMKYNQVKRYWLLQGYAKAVEKGDIHVLTGFKVYEKVALDVEKNIIGITTSEGTKIDSYTTHFIDRVIGQTSEKHIGMREGTPVGAVKDALENPIKVDPPKIMPTGDIRQRYYGRSASVVISILDNRLIQATPRKEER